jgi:hypothetical protein
MEYGFVGPLDIPADHFHPDLKSSAIVIRNARDEGANDFADTILHLIQTTPPGEPQDLARAKVADIGDCVPHRPEALVGSAAIVREYYLVKARVMAGWKLQRTLEAGDDPTEVLREIQSLVDSTQSGSLASQLADRAFDAAIVPDKPVPILRVNGKDVLSEGNLLNVQAQLKAGKTAVIGAMIAAIFPAARLGADTLGFSAENTEGLAVIHFDTEQSRFDHDSLIRRSLARAGLKEPPDWFYSYSITDLDDGVRLDAFLLAIANAAEAHGGVFAIILDGIADICMDPNDPPESFALVRKLQTTAINYSCGIITVLHENPGSDIGKTRGHLGSQLARKAETNLRLATRTCVPKSLNAGARRTSNRFGRIAPFRSIASLPTMTTRSGRTSCSTASSMGVGLCGSKISSAASLMPCSSSVAPAASQSSINCCVAAVRPIRNARSST